ncbi:MAG TPA: PKD domain-containing protein, partial [Pyrinomonadaceae bacterium]
AANPSHTYMLPGPFVATLTVTDNDGAQTMQTILVKAVAPNQLPVAVASAVPTSGPPPLDVIFYADGSYDPDGFLGNLQWTFSDGGTYWGSPAYHTFDSAGTYTATLTVYDSRGATGTTTLTVYVGVNPPPQPPSIVSRKTHGTAGTFDINLPLTGTPGIECRSGGSNSDHEVVFTFASAVTLSGATVTPQAGMSGSMVGAPNISPDGRTVTLHLTNVTDAQTIAITLAGVSNGASTNDIAVPMSLLVGDTNADRVVNAGDVLQTRNRSGGPASSTSFRSDVNTDGAVNSGDTLIIRARSGDFLP